MPSKIMSFGEFEKVYEANNYLLEDDAAAAPPKDDPQTSVISADGSIEEQPSEILDLLKNLSGEKGEEAEKAPNESLEEQQAFVTEATPVKKIAPKAATTSKPTNTLKPALMGEESERVKEIQKTLGLDPSGKFDQGTKDAVMAFQKENKLVVDGKVGTQTYGQLLKIKKGISDEAEIAKQIEAFKKAGKMVISVSKGKSIALDPRFYDVFERIEIVTNNGTTYVVATPKADAATKIEEMKKDNLIASGFEWLLAVPAAVGKAIVYTAVAAVVIPIEVAKGMVNAAISAGAYVGKTLMGVASNVVYGIGQIAKWVQSKGAQAWSSLKQAGNDALVLWKGFTDKAKTALKASAEGIIAFASAAANSLGKTYQSMRSMVHKAAIEIGKGLNMAWEGTKHLGELVKTGLSKIKDGAKAFVAKVETAYNEVVARTKAIGSAVAGGLKSAGNSVLNVIKSGVSTAGDALISMGSWVKGLVESLEAGNGELVLEGLEY